MFNQYRTGVAVISWVTRVLKNHEINWPIYTLTSVFIFIYSIFFISVHFLQFWHWEIFNNQEPLNHFTAYVNQDSKLNLFPNNHFVISSQKRATRKKLEVSRQNRRIWAITHIIFHANVYPKVLSYPSQHPKKKKSSTRWCWLLVLIFFSEKAQAKKIVFGVSYLVIW